MSVLCFVLAAGVVVADHSSSPVRQQSPTEVMIFCDTEDFTSDLSHDAARDLAKLFTEEGVRAHFAVVGYLARQWSALKRQDVCDALRPHVIGCHTLKHSVPPDIIERADVADAEEAVARTFKDESLAFDLIERALGKRPLFGVPPGISKTCEAMYVYAKLGAPNYCDTVVTDGKDGDLWYANVRQFPYFYEFMIEDMLPGAGPEPDYGRILDCIARHRRVLLFEHPNMICHTKFWDSINYRWGNNSAWGQWKKAPVRPAADVALYLRRQRELIRRLKADPRIVLTDLERVMAKSRPRVAISRADMPRLRDRLKSDFACIREPSWCVADVYQAAVRFLRGDETSHMPGFVHGFSAAPRGVTQRVVVSAEDVRQAARALNTEGFIPPVICVGNVDLGPADFLLAALDVLADEASPNRAHSAPNRITIEPKDQLGDIRKYPKLANFKPEDPGFSKTFKDRYVSERQKLQFWTLRYE